MTKKAKRPPLGKRIIAGLGDAVAHAKGETNRVVVRAPERIDVRAIRTRQKMSQREFADAYGFSLDSVQNWESGRRHPTGAARVLLLVIDRDPAAVSRALKSSAA